MTEPNEQARQDADSDLYDSIYGTPQRTPLSEENETLYATFYTPTGPAPLTDEDQQTYNALIPEN